jgi:hypothetical protein
MQLPLRALLRVPLVRHKRLGNLILWAGLAVGMSAIAALYASEVCAKGAACGSVAPLPGAEAGAAGGWGQAGGGSHDGSQPSHAHAHSHSHSYSHSYSHAVPPPRHARA